MSRYKVRVGNDLAIQWSFFQDKAKTIPLSLTGRTLSVYLSNTTSKWKLPSIVVEGNFVGFTLSGVDQLNKYGTGIFNLICIENEGQENQHVLDMITCLLFVSQAEESVSGSAEGTWTLLETGVAYFGSAALTYFETIEHAEQTYAKKTELPVPHPYISLERLRNYLYRVTFDSLPEDNGGSDFIPAGCSSYVKDGKLYRNLDFKYDNSASFIVRTKDFEGMAFVTGLNDGELTDEKIAQLPYRVVDGVNNYGIKVSTHILFNDWGWNSPGHKTIPLTKLPYLVLSRVKSIATMEEDLAGIWAELYAPESMGEYLLQVLFTDGVRTIVIQPPGVADEPYSLSEITPYPKLANFLWVNRASVERTDQDIQTRPTGIERFNMMPCELRELAFTEAYRTPNRLSEFIGIDETTKESTDEELTEIYNLARAEYLHRERDGKTWQTMHSVVYGSKLEALYVQEDWSENCANAQGLWESGKGEHSIQTKGTSCVAKGNFSSAEGYASMVVTDGEGEHPGDYAHAEGLRTTAGGAASHTEGGYTHANNPCEHAQGRGNVSNFASTEFGDSGNTIHSVGIGGTEIGTFKNAFEIMQDGGSYFIGIGGYNGKNPSDALSLQKIILAIVEAIPTKTSELENDSGFLSEHQSLEAYRTAEEQDRLDSEKLKVEDQITNAEIDNLN